MSLKPLNICLVGLDNLPVIDPAFRELPIGGESVQQTLLAKALAARGHRVSMVCTDHGQRDGGRIDGVTLYKAYRPDAGLPLLRFIHPRWSALWRALARADAHIYYTSCAGMLAGLLAMFCRLHGRRFVFRTASDSDCDPRTLLIRYARDRKLYTYGLRRADAVLVQSQQQAEQLARNFDLQAEVAGMLVETPAASPERDIDLLWVSNVRQVKRPDRMLALARAFPQARVHMVGGALPGEEALFEQTRAAAQALPNVTFHGRLPYWDANRMYDRARLFVNTSDVEGFPNAYLQAWIRGVPVVTFIDPDDVIERQGLGRAVTTLEAMQDTLAQWLADPRALADAAARCREYMAREFAPDTVLGPYLAAFTGGRPKPDAAAFILSDGAPHA